MPEKKTMERVRQDKREGKSPTTQAGEFGGDAPYSRGQAWSPLCQASNCHWPLEGSTSRRRSTTAEEGTVTEKTRKSAERAWKKGQEEPKQKPSRTRSRAIHRVLEEEGSAAASHQALSRQTHSAARNRTAKERSVPRRKRVAKGHAGLVKAAQEAARTRSANRSS